MIKNRQAAVLGVLIIALLYLYTVFYEDIREEENIREYVEQAKSDIARNPVMRAVMIQGKLYYDTGKESPRTHCGLLHGAITSTVDRSKMPTEDNQSNFGTDFGYCYITDDAVALYINEKWIIFACPSEALPEAADTIVEKG